MKKFSILSSLFFLALIPGLAGATHEEDQGRLEISQGWVDRHNEKLDPIVKDAVKGLKPKDKVHHRASLKYQLVPMKRLRLSIAAKHDIPLQKILENRAPVSLVALYQAVAQDQSFLIADYADEQSDLHCSSDIYWKMGLKYYQVFHGKGYRKCARVMTIGKDSPLFFEVAQYGGGARCDKTIYTFDRPSLSMISEHLYRHPETMKPMDYILEALNFSVWLDGVTIYRDVDKDGTLEVINMTQALCPKDLQEMLKSKYPLTDNDFDKAFRKIASVYKWNDAKSKFEDAGDYYF